MSGTDRSVVSSSCCAAATRHCARYSPIVMPSAATEHDHRVLRIQVHVPGHVGDRDVRGRVRRHEGRHRGGGRARGASAGAGGSESCAARCRDRRRHAQRERLDLGLGDAPLQRFAAELCRPPLGELVESDRGPCGRAGHLAAQHPRQESGGQPPGECGLQRHSQPRLDARRGAADELVRPRRPEDRDGAGRDEVGAPVDHVLKVDVGMVELEIVVPVRDRHAARGTPPAGEAERARLNGTRAHDPGILPHLRGGSSGSWSLA